MGAERATRAATWLVQHYALHGLLSVGFAGGLQAAPATGDALLPQQVLAWSGDLQGATVVQTAPLCTDVDLARLATLSAHQAHLRQYQGTLLTVPGVLRHAATKQHLGQRSGALAADMESYSIGQVAVAHAIPFMPLRTIFDTCNDDIPWPVERCISANGVVRPLRVLGALALHPGAFLHTVPMWRQAQRAGHALVAWLQHFLPLLSQATLSQEDRQCLR
jgi:nucleoside phosphorylase